MRPYASSSDSPSPSLFCVGSERFGPRETLTLATFSPAGNGRSARRLLGFHDRLSSFEGRFAADLDVGWTQAVASDAMSGATVFRCGGHEHRVEISTRDAHLLDDRYFVARYGSFRALFGLDFVAGLGTPPLHTVLSTASRFLMTSRLQALLGALEDQRDLVSYNYGFVFDGKAEMKGGGGVSGFSVGGLFGALSTRPSGYCWLELSNLAPTGRGRVVEMVDMRVRRSIQTDDWGMLTVTGRPADVGWFTTLPPLIEWLGKQEPKEVEVLHA